MGPRADFTCLSKKCQQDGAASVYEDLPINTTRCPVCGSKRVRRLYTTAPGMIRSGGRQLQHVIDVAGADAQEVKSDNTDSRLRQLKHRAPALAVPMSNLNATLASLGAGALPMADVMGGRKLNPIAKPLLNHLGGRAPRPGEGSLRDTEHRIVGGKIVKS